MKGQSSIEYLATYGWMFVAVGLVSGALYGTGFMNFCTNSASGMDIQSLQLDDFGVSTDNELQLVLENRDPQAFSHHVKQVEIEDTQTGDTVLVGVDQVVDAGTRERVDLDNFETVTGCNNFDIQITFDRGDVLPNQKVSGTLTSDMEITEEIIDPYEEQTLEISSVNDNTPIEEGETLQVDYTISNDGNEEQEEEVEFSVSGPSGEEYSDSETLTIDAGSEESGSFDYEPENTGNYEYAIEIEEDRVEESFEVQDEEEEEEVEVEIIGTNSPVEEEETLEIDYEAVNNNEEDEENHVFQLDFADNGEIDGEEEVDIDAGETIERTFAYDTEDEDPGEYDVRVNSEDDTDVQTIEITEEGEPVFEVISLDSPEEAEQEEEITVNTEIENTGSETGSRDIELRLGDNVNGEEGTDYEVLAVEEDFELEDGSSEEIVFEEEIPSDQETGDQEIGIDTEDDSEHNIIEILSDENAELEQLFVEDNSICQGNNCNAENIAEFTFDWELTDPNSNFVETEVFMPEEGWGESSSDLNGQVTFSEEGRYEDEFVVEYRAFYDGEDDICREKTIVADEENHDMTESEVDC